MRQTFLSTTQSLCPLSSYARDGVDLGSTIRLDRANQSSFQTRLATYALEQDTKWQQAQVAVRSPLSRSRVLSCRFRYSYSSCREGYNPRFARRRRRLVFDD